MGITKVRLTKADIIAAVRDENYGDSDLSNFANLSGSGLIERKSEGVIETVPVTDYIKTLLNDATAADARSTMGLGSMATASTSSYQPIGNELTALQALVDVTGFLKKTGDGTYSIDNNNYLPLAGGTVTGDLVSTSATASTSTTTGAIRAASLGITGAIFAGTLNGNGSGLTTLNASNLSSGAVNIARIPTGTTSTTVSLGDHTHNYLPLAGGILSDALTIKKTVAGAAFEGLTIWNDSTTTSTSAAINLVANTAGSVRACQITSISPAGINQSSLVFKTSNSTLPTTVLTLGYDLTATFVSSVTATSFSGSGTSLTSLNASNIASGTVNIARIPTGTTSTTVSLGDHTHNYLPLAGGTVTGVTNFSNATPSTSTTTGASVIAGGQGIGGNQHIAGFTSLGGVSSGHPAVKIKYLIGTTAATQGGIAQIAPGVTTSQIIHISALVEHSPGVYVADAHQYSPGYYFDISTSSTSVQVANHPTSSFSVLGKPIKITIIYTE